MESYTNGHTVLDDDQEEPDDSIAMATSHELYDFLLHAELEHYHNAMRNDLKVASVPQLKYVREEDLLGIGMTKPEMRRLKKFYRKEHPQGIERIYRAIRKTGDPTSRALSPPAVEHRTSVRSAYFNPLAKQIIPYENLTEQTTLGEGEFGVVQKGVWTTDKGDQVQVAIKCLSKEKLQSATTEFLKEAGLMQSIDHDHIVRMFGVVLDKENTLMLVTELASLRSLLECLKDQSLRLDFPITQLCDFAQQICDGMAYLETKRLIHRDLAARNVLVFSKTQVKISDFGLSRALGVGNDYYQTRFTSNLKLPIAWCAPEAISYLKFTSASDVWSYGVTLWELFTYGQQPWSGLSGQQILETIDIPRCGRLTQPEYASKGYYDLMLSCWEHEPLNRPTFAKIYSKLPQLRPVFVKATRDYPEPVVQKDDLFYKAYDAIIVLDKCPPNPPQSGHWKGMLNTGKSGFFDPTNTAPFTEVKNSPVELRVNHVVRRAESARKPGGSRKLRLDMISRPMDDLRHTGHIGYDGAVFGDVSFMGDNVNKIPVKSIIQTSNSDLLGSSQSLPRYADSGGMRDSSVRISQSELSLNLPSTNGIGHSWMSEMSLNSQMETTDSSSGDKTPSYNDIDDDLDGFKLPDLSTCMDFGPSFMDEVFKALEEKHEKSAPARSSAERERSHSPPVDPIPVSQPIHEPVPSPRRISPLPATQRQPSPRKSTSREQSPAIREMSPIRVDVSRTDAERDQSPVASKRVYKKEDSPSRSVTDPPPVPSNLPRVESIRRDANVEPPKRQAKVKPMSTSSLKMLGDVLASSATDTLDDGPMFESSSPPVISESKGSESPTLVTRLKNSLKKSSPKDERKRVFSEELSNKSSTDQSDQLTELEAYNELVTKGCIKASSLTRVPSDRPLVAPKPSPKPRTEPLRSGSNTRPEIHVLRVEPTPRQAVEPIVRSVDNHDDDETSDGYLDDKVLNMPPTATEEDSHLDSDNDIAGNNAKDIDIKKIQQANDADDDAVFVKPSQVEMKISGGIPTYRSSARQISGAATATKSRFADLKNGSAKSNFDEEFSEPSPREIMSRLARDSRLRRGSDLSDGSEGLVNRNLREPQGIPGKSVSSVNSANGDDEEVDTNPLRMLRGGAIPIQRGRVGTGRRVVRR